MLAVPKITSKVDPSDEGNLLVSVSTEKVLGPEPSENLASSEKLSEELTNEYMQLQLRIFRSTLIITTFAVLITAIIFDIHSAISLFLGASAGILYLRLLARGIGKLGKSSMSVSKVQLLVPIVLFFAVSRFPQVELLPALLGFFLYKPSLIVQFLLET